VVVALRGRIDYIIGMRPLIISSCMAPNMDFLCHDLAAYFADHLSIPVDTVMDISWQEREKRLDQGKIDIGWICGLWYVRKVERYPGKFEPLAAPVMTASRYQNQPIYFSDVVVHRDSPFHSLMDLKGANWAYNEPESHSGFELVRYTLAERGESFRMFNRILQSGSHQNSLDMILRREVDGSAIDSTVLEMELSNNPGLEDQLRVIDTFGPSPIPPWVVSNRIPEEIKEALRDLLTRMDSDPSGQAILKKARMSRFVPVSDNDYDPIRVMARIDSGS
jgi:phosphonate transport system substrate-binding protein